ncbi:hypothetical protein [Dongia sp.]|uniref:hypothetical protein n=1 Tax=Dongia sp. TaxID=1977262 RepID=UPI003751F090
MKIRTVLLAVAAASSLSTAAFAAANPHDTNHPSNREQMLASCSALESQYDGIVGGKLHAPKTDKAAGLHAQGVSACDSNNSDIGVMKLERAVRILGARPVA